MSDNNTPLISAHNHARNAAEEYCKANRKGSSEEHQQAVNDFSRAARTTGDGEALRVLKLLEAQHARLAYILQRDDTVPVGKAADVQGSAQESETKVSRAATTTEPKSPEGAANTKVKSQSMKAASRVGSQIRESSPSLARDIATRRGIPPTGRGPLSAAAQARTRQLSPEAKRTRHSDQAGVPSRIPPSIVESHASLREARKAEKAEDDEGFTKFYSNITTGTMAKLSSALAYAGLPLTADDIKNDQPSQKRTVSASNDLDVKKYISKAALDAVEDQHRKRGTFGHGFGPSESFYFVQTGGGTYSYADITKNRQAPLSTMEEDDEESFVDARELPGPASPKRSRAAPQKRGTFGKNKTHEELELENSTLKGTIDFLSSRLSHFEAHAQDAAMASMTQSMINLHPPQEDDESAMQKRLRQLEQQVEKQAEERQQLEHRAAKQAKALEKYHSKWQEIKNSAKEKNKAKREKAEKDGGGGENLATGVPDVN